MNKKKLLQLMLKSDLITYLEYYEKVYSVKINFNKLISQKIINFKIKLNKNSDIKSVINLKALSINKAYLPMESSKTENLNDLGSKNIQKNTKLENDDFISLKHEVGNCQLCGLYKTRKKVVFGSGTYKIELVIIGEAPGAEEDCAGKPFVGKSGQLLTKMLQAIKIDREDIFICNVLKCRPPMNRDPNADEIANCSKYLDRQLEILKPKYILILGRIAAKRILNKDLTMQEFRQENNFYKGIPVIVTYHPSALLRNSKWKAPAWEDLKKLQSLLGIN